MLIRIRDRLARILPRGALLLSVLTFGSYLVGLLRDRTFARTFGAAGELDAYNAALSLPELTLDVLVIAGLTSAFIPMFTKTRRDDAQAADRFSRTVLTAVIMVMVVADAILFVLAPATVSIVAPGFDVHQRDLYIELFRVMCVSGVIFAASLALGEMLVARQRFLSYGLAPILYNAGIALGALALAPSMGIHGVAVGTVVGALLHLGIRVVEIRRTDFRFRPDLYLRTTAFREYVRLSIPKMLSQPIEPLTYLFFTSVASTFVAGSVSQVSYARNFQSVPVSLVGVAFAVAAFPILSAAAAAGDRARFVRLTVTNVLTILILTTAAAIMLYLVAEPVIRLLLGGGAFDAEDVAATTLLLQAFALSIPLESVTQVLSRAIYATRNTVLPAAASILGLLVTVATVSLLTPDRGIVALPLGFATGMATKVVVLSVALAVRVRGMAVLTDGQPADA
jgi:putative peptidoglycan lipid II flippase